MCSVPDVTQVTAVHRKARRMPNMCGVVELGQSRKVNREYLEGRRTQSGSLKTSLKGSP